ncbi:MAG: hypothetical protein GXY13_15315 [Acidimicrobiales bacterium]|nr:hypothetical protein [Acidimicrobiales bacterium]
MIGAVVIVVVLLVAIPIFVAVNGAVIAAALGQFLKSNGEATNEGSELIPLNR